MTFTLYSDAEGFQQDETENSKEGTVSEYDFVQDGTEKGNEVIEKESEKKY